MNTARKKPVWSTFTPKPKRNLAPQSAEIILAKALKRYGIDKDIARYDFIRHWDKIVGDEIAKRAAPEYVRGDTLVVRVKDSAWAQELSFQKDVILQRLRKVTNNTIDLQDVHFYVGA